MEPLTEERTWSPRVRFEPIKNPKPSNADLARQGEQLHTCLEEAHSKIDNVTIVVDEIKMGLGLTPEGKKPAGLSSPRVAFLRTVGATATAIGGFVVLYKATLVLIPVVVIFAKAVDHAIRTGAL